MSKPQTDDYDAASPDACFWWQAVPPDADARPASRPGERCPECQQGVLDYDSQFRMTCAVCHYTPDGGVCT